MGLLAPTHYLRWLRTVILENSAQLLLGVHENVFPDLIFHVFIAIRNSGQCKKMIKS